MSYLKHQQLCLNNVQQHHRVHSLPDVPFSWEMSPGVSKHHEQSSGTASASGSRRHSSEKLQDYLARHRHEEYWHESHDDKELLPYYLAEENARRAIRKPPLRPPPYLTSSPRVSSSPRTELPTRAPSRAASKLCVRKGSGADADADPFLAAYMKCTTSRQDAAAKRKSAGFAFSCKSSVAAGIRDDALVRIRRPST